jgi:hypothetical protein
MQQGKEFEPTASALLADRNATAASWPRTDGALVTALHAWPFHDSRNAYPGVRKFGSVWPTANARDADRAATAIRPPP